LTQERQENWLKNTLRHNKMAHIKEPEGVDFLIQSPPLTDKERKEISELIKKMKAKSPKKRAIKTRQNKKELSE